jgi:solute carrier family 8 (sodium/calcium exchanger)
VYSFLENCGTAKVVILRAGPLHCRASIRFTTIEGTAKNGDDFDPRDEEIVFEKDEVEKTIEIVIKDDDNWESDEFFTIKLSNAKICEETSSCTAVAEEAHSVTTVNIIDDDAPGELRFEVEDKAVDEGDDDHVADIIVSRFNGSTGEISCKYETDQEKAQEGIDYEALKGTLNFKDGQKKATIPVYIKGRTRVDSATFNLILKDPVGTKFDATTEGGAEKCICHITIVHRDKADMMNAMLDQIHSADAVGHRNWAQQFYDAIFEIGDGDDDEEEEAEEGAEPQPKDPPGKFDIFMHVISVPWKLLFAFIPPVDYLGGWACFCSALVFIGGVTWMVSDMANLVGCCLGLLPEENAITFVALGTSLPDTFASQTAAMMDPYADASIGNVTGSNSVNVFLGIGLSWAVAAFYWLPKDGEEYVEATITGGVVDMSSLKKATYDGTFKTCAGSIWFNLMVFCLNALAAIQHLFARRKKWGGELGGPKKGMFGQYFSAGFLVFQWFVYIGASSIWARTAGTALTYTQMAMMDEFPDVVKRMYPDWPENVEYTCPDPYQNDKCAIL